MNKADVSIPYLVAIILGIIVLLLAAYLIYKYIMKSPISCTQCGTELTAWCVKCYKMFGKTNWAGTNTMDQKLSDCVVKCNLLSGGYSSCDATSLEFCKSYIPL